MHIITYRGQKLHRLKFSLLLLPTFCAFSVPIIVKTKATTPGPLAPPSAQFAFLQLSKQEYLNSYYRTIHSELLTQSKI